MATSFDEQIIPVYAALHPDGGVEVELLIPGQDDSVTITIPPIAETKRLAVPDQAVVIQLDADWDDRNGKLRRLVSEFVERSEKKRQDALRLSQGGRQRR